MSRDCRTFKQFFLLFSMLMLINCADYKDKLGAAQVIPQQRLQDTNSETSLNQARQFLQLKFTKLFGRYLGKLLYGTEQSVAGKLYMLAFQIEDDTNIVIEGRVVVRPWLGGDEAFQFLQFKTNFKDNQVQQNSIHMFDYKLGDSLKPIILKSYVYSKQPNLSANKPLLLVTIRDADIPYNQKRNNQKRN